MAPDLRSIIVTRTKTVFTSPLEPARSILWHSMYVTQLPMNTMVSTRTPPSYFLFAVNQKAVLTLAIVHRNICFDLGHRRLK